MIAIPWYFTVVLGEHMRFGIFYGIITLVSAFWSLYAGVLIDRYDRQKILVIQCICGFVLLGIAALLMYTTTVPISIIAAIVFSFTAFVYNIHYPNMYAFAQEISDPKDYQRVISYLEIQGQTTTIIGGGLAAVFLSGFHLDLSHFISWLSIDMSPLELSQIFIFNSLTYVLALIIYCLIRYEPIVVRVYESESPVQRFFIGWNYLQNRPALLLFGWASLGVFICVLLISFYLMPSYVSLFLGEKSHVFAISEMTYALGSVAAGYFARYILKQYDEVTKILFCFCIGLIVLLFFSWNTQLFIFYFCHLLLGYANASIRYYRVSYMWSLVPNQLNGRVSSVTNLSSYVCRALLGFVFVLPYFHGRIGMQHTMLFLAGFVFMTGLAILYTKPHLMRMAKQSI